MLTHIIRTVVTTLARELTAQTIRKAFKTKPKDKRNSYYKGRR